MPNELTPAQRRTLKGRAHTLTPVVHIGVDGLTPTVLAEIDRALHAHELIKIRVLGADGDAREDLLSELCAATNAAPVQHIGKVLVVYREEPAAVVPAAPTRKPATRREPRSSKPRPALSRRAKLRSR
jgi:putative YhbY family RNA-binding protein